MNSKVEITREDVVLLVKACLNMAIAEPGENFLQTTLRTYRVTKRLAEQLGITDVKAIAEHDATIERFIDYDSFQVRLSAAEQKYSALFTLNDELFEAAVELLAACDQGLYTGHAEKDLQSIIDKFTGKSKPTEPISANPHWPANSAEELAEFMLWMKYREQANEQ